ncbi:unnamed protein product [Sphenostylis stenocarpa]|uniref:Uncharacterized protein n=1 Tax=Sphenostylis stenocarpa TaxID=92480 RepID=A0AA86VVG9_9FABA|nr:unnamed protein product [Sphenostylis stenocarpa]
MAKSSGVWILPFITAWWWLSTAAMARGSNSTTIYDELRAQGLPVGLLPKGVAKYSLNGTSGEFEVWMEEPCNAKFENEVHYDSNIKGILGFGRIGKLSGVSAQELFLWFPVKGIRVDVPTSGLIHFDVGVADKQFSLSLFEDPPDCKPQVGLSSFNLLTPLVSLQSGKFMIVSDGFVKYILVFMNNLVFNSFRLRLVVKVCKGLPGRK